MVNISVENFSKKYGEFLAVDNISFQVKGGQINRLLVLLVKMEQAKALLYFPL